jgi:hypothetical protein
LGRRLLETQAFDESLWGLADGSSKMAMEVKPRFSGSPRNAG